MSRKSWHSLPEYQALRAMMQGGTVTDAADRLGLSQSAVSRSIGNLEERTGLTLFEREAGRLRPTEEAVRLNLRLDPLFDALDQIDGPKQPVQETLRLIAPPTYAHRFLVSQIASFLAINPHFFVSLDVNTSDEVVRGILDDRFDLGLSGVELERVGVRMQAFRACSAVCVMTADHPLARQDLVHPIDLDGQAFVAIANRHASRRRLDKVLGQARCKPRIMAEVSTSFAAVDLAKEGLGLAVVNPFPVYHYRSSDLAFRRFVSPIEYRSHFVMSDQRPLPRIARAFMRHLRLHTPPDPYSKKVSAPGHK
ncbi:LysR family transcriptional regulator [Pseudophaeobacter sp.]|uniref:LysR family transcriptional regulator n=1 Tax=Pseudophaeobacter sp. TaxID=1971739 RepID=UPI003299EC0F